MPDHEALLALEPEELAGIVLEYLHSLSPRDSGQLNRYNFGLHHTVKEYPHQYQDEISRALMEAWVWLEREGFLAPEPGDTGNWVFITRRGHQLKTAVDVEAYRKTNLLPKQFLHPVIAYKVWSLFLRGEYDTAVFQAFKEVEVAVRDAGGYAKKDYGVNLMRQAFHPQNGALTDPSQLPAEKDATLALFAGAIGLYKNPPSHRNVNVTPVEAAEMIIFANSLLKIVDSTTLVSPLTL
jgi:uncharacterized protein (TIGR02391 family)